MQAVRVVLACRRLSFLKRGAAPVAPPGQLAGPASMTGLSPADTDKLVGYLREKDV